MPIFKIFGVPGRQCRSFRMSVCATRGARITLLGPAWPAWPCTPTRNGDYFEDRCALPGGAGPRMALQFPTGSVDYFEDRCARPGGAQITPLGPHGPAHRPSKNSWLPVGNVDYFENWCALPGGAQITMLGPSWPCSPILKIIEVPGRQSR